MGAHLTFGKDMKKPFKLLIRLVAVCALIGAVMVGYDVIRLAHGYHDTNIISTGPFASRFPTLYPDHKKEIEDWFHDVIPPGTKREKAREILSKSFTTDLTSGRLIVIDEDKSLAGISSTSVKLYFDTRGMLESVEIKQQYVYL